MARTYTTVNGDMWDGIAYKTMGSCSCMGQLLEANPDWADYFQLPSGVVLTVPDVPEPVNRSLPPWRR